MSLTGRVALVTGASRGIGAAIADTLAAAGARVIGTATSESGAAAIAARLAPFGGTGLVFDTNQDAAVETLMAAVESTAGPVEILVNNAGITRDQLLMRMKDDDWDAIMNTNLRPVYQLSKAVLRGMMKARRGRIVSIASIVGTMGVTLVRPTTPPPKPP